MNGEYFPGFSEGVFSAVGNHSASQNVLQGFYQFCLRLFRGNIDFHADILKYKGCKCGRRKFYMLIYSHPEKKFELHSGVAATLCAAE